MQAQILSQNEIAFKSKLMQIQKFAVTSFISQISRYNT